MAFSITALQLVNRVHRRRRMPDTGAFVNTMDLATLNAVNSSIEEILTGKKWEFDIRTNGQITTLSNSTDLLMSGTNSTLIGLFRSTGLNSDELSGDFVLRILPTSSSDYANTALRVVSTGLVITGTTAFVTIESVFPETSSNVEAELFYSEYIMPDTVESIIRATYQEYPLTLEQVDPKVSYSEIFPRPHIERGPPEIISVGGLDVRTYESVIAGAEPPGLRVAIWPVPDDEYIINYNYYYRHPELSAVGDVLEGVPPNVVSRIIDLATADIKVFYEKDYEALALRRSTMDSSNEIWKSHGGSRSARKGVGNWDTSGRSGGVQRGFPGKLLGS